MYFLSSRNWKCSFSKVYKVNFCQHLCWQNSICVSISEKSFFHYPEFHNRQILPFFFWPSKMSYLIRILLLDRSPSLSDCHLSQLNSSLVYFQSHTYSYMQFKHDRFNSWLFLFMFYAPFLPYIKVLVFDDCHGGLFAVMGFIFPNVLISDILYIVFST